MGYIGNVISITNFVNNGFAHSGQKDLIGTRVTGIKQHLSKNPNQYILKTNNKNIDYVICNVKNNRASVHIVYKKEVKDEKSGIRKHKSTS